MQLRIFLYKPDESIRQPLFAYLQDLGHQVAVVDFPQVCLTYHSPDGHNCSAKAVCADVVIVGDAVSAEEGLSMLEKQVKAGCPGVRNNAIICDDLSHEARLCAERIGCHLFQKPLNLEAVGMWLTVVIQGLDLERELSPFTIGGTAELVTAGSGE